MPFLSVDLIVWVDGSLSFCYLLANSLFCTFVKAAMVVGRACISKTLTTPCHAVWQMQGYLNIKKKKKKKILEMHFVQVHQIVLTCICVYLF